MPFVPPDTDTLADPDAACSTSCATRTISRAHHPEFPAPLRRAASDYLRDMGCALRPPYAALALVNFLDVHAGRSVVCSADIRALFPHPREELAGALRNPSDILRRAAARGLVEPLGDGWYRMTALGREVVAVLPDEKRVAELRGCRTVSCGVGRRRRLERERS